MTKNQNQLIKVPWEEEPKVQAFKLLTTRSSNLKFFVKARREKKNHCKREQQGQQNQKSSTPATAVNAAKSVKAKKNDD